MDAGYSNTLKKFFFLLLVALTPFISLAQEPTEHAATAQHEEGKFRAGEMILHHVGDSPEWHFATIGHTHLTLPLPVILYVPGGGLDVFSSSRFHNETRTYGDYKLDEHDHITSLSGNKFYNFSITKNVASLMLSAILLIAIFFTVAGAYKKNHGRAPRGIQSFFEPIILFVRDDIARPNIGPKYERYMPYLLTVFFFIWFNNLLGLMPGGANLTGNIAVTLVLALITLLIVLFSSNKYYWQHIFATPGVPAWLLPIMIPVELIGIITKPFSLMVRLFANITAGHIIILSLFSLIFIAKSIAVGPVIVGFALFMNVLELLVAILQAYVFTMLSALYIGSAVEEHEHAHGDLGIDHDSVDAKHHH